MIIAFFLLKFILGMGMGVVPPAAVPKLAEADLLMGVMKANRANLDKLAQQAVELKDNILGVITSGMTEEIVKMSTDFESILAVFTHHLMSQHVMVDTFSHADKIKKLNLALFAGGMAFRKHVRTMHESLAVFLKALHDLSQNPAFKLKFPEAALEREFGSLAIRNALNGNTEGQRTLPFSAPKV